MACQDLLPAGFSACIRAGKRLFLSSVALLWPAAYNQICMFLGANWYALAASAGLALLFIIHIIYALWLTVQNRKARGNDRYAVNAH